MVVNSSAATVSLDPSRQTMCPLAGDDEDVARVADYLSPVACRAFRPSCLARPGTLRIGLWSLELMLQRHHDHPT